MKLGFDKNIRFRWFSGGRGIATMMIEDRPTPG
jgi:hypothetical protein